MEERFPYRLNLALAAAGITVSFYRFFLLPLVLLPLHPLWLLSLIPCAALANSHWFLIHETFHRGFHPRAAINDAAGRILSICFGAPFHVIRFGHLMHHRFNGALIDRTDLYVPGAANGLWVRASYYLQLFGGLYLQEFFSAALFFCGKQTILAVISRLMQPQDEKSAEIKKFALSMFSRDGVIRSIRIDGCIMYAVFGASLICYGHYWGWAVLLFFTRGFLVSFANNAAHYGTPRSDVSYALNLRLPLPLMLLYLNFYCHRCHHHNPTLPWTRLPSAMHQTGDTFDGAFIDAALAQLKGPLSVDAVDGLNVSQGSASN